MKLRFKKSLSFTVTILCVVITMLATNGCRKSKTSPKICNVENPLTDLLWMKEKIDEFNLLVQGNQNLSIAIYQCKYGNEEIGFLIDEGNTKPFYNCNGDILCIMGGFAGETCSELKIVNKEIIWEKDNTKDIWAWKNVHDANSTITLSIHRNTVSVSKSPKEDGDYDQFHQFRDGDQYLLQNDTLYLKNLDGTIVYPPIDFFEITQLSENEMKLEYLGIRLEMPFYIYNYVFNRVIIE